MRRSESIDCPARVAESGSGSPVCERTVRDVGLAPILDSKSPCTNAAELREDDRVDLDELDHAVAARVLAWRAADVRWEIIRWPVTDKPASSLRVERDDAMAELILWVSGEAELISVRHVADQTLSEHYEVTTALGLNGCLDDLEAHIGL